MTWNSPVHQQSVEIVRAQLSRVGIKANIEVLTVGAATEKYFVGRKTAIYYTSWPRNPEPDTHAAYGFKSGGFYNVSRQTNPVMDGLLRHGATTYDQDKRKEIYRRVNDLVLGQTTWHPLLYGVTYAAAPKKVQNLNTLIAWDGRINVKELWIRS